MESERTPRVNNLWKKSSYADHGEQGETEIPEKQESAQFKWRSILHQMLKFRKGIEVNLKMVIHNYARLVIEQSYDLESKKLTLPPKMMRT